MAAGASTTSTTATIVVGPAAPTLAPPPPSGFVTFHLFGHDLTLNPMVCVLLLMLAFAAWWIWNEQKGDNSFDLMDMVMDQVPKLDAVSTVRKLSLIKICFLFAFGLSSWVIVDQQIKGSLSADVFGLYLGVWCGALIAKVIWDKPFDASTILATLGKKSDDHH